MDIVRHLKLKIKGINDKELWEKYKATWAKIKDLKSIELNTLPVYDDRYIKSKRRTFDEKVLRYYDCNWFKQRNWSS